MNLAERISPIVEKNSKKLCAVNVIVRGICRPYLAEFSEEGGPIVLTPAVKDRVFKVDDQNFYIARDTGWTRVHVEYKAF